MGNFAIAPQPVFLAPGPVGSQVVTDTVTVVPIAAGAAATLVLAANPAARTRTLINDGVGDAYYGYDPAVTSATGMPLYANGGGFSWGAGEVDPRAIYAVSTSGTTIRVKEGV